MSHLIHHTNCGCGPSRRGLMGAAAIGTAAVLAAGATTAQAQPAKASGRPGGRGPVIDAHVHLQALDWFTGEIFRAPNVQVRRRAGPPPRLPSRGAQSISETGLAASGRRYGPGLADQTQKLLDEMDAAGVDVSILFAMDYDYTGEKLSVLHWEQLVLLAGVRDKHPGRFILFAAVDPRRGRAGVELLRRAHRELGIVGMGEFAPHFFGFAPNDKERCYPIYEACAELGLHIAPNCSIVRGMISRWCDPIYFEDVAIDFPQVNVSLTSAGKPHWAETAIALAQSKPNVYLDIGDWQAKTTSDPLGHVIAFVRRALDTDARHKILFGTDYPVYNAAVSTKTWLEVFTIEASKRGVRFTDEDLFLLFSDNAQEFLNMDVPMPARSARA